MAIFQGQDLTTEGRSATNIGGLTYTPADHSYFEGFDTITAQGDDTLYGGPQATFDQNNPLWGAGNDLLQGYAGSDTLYGGADDDILFGDARPNREGLGGEDGADQLFGGNGQDTLGGNLGDDTLDGEAGDDTALLAGVQANYIFNGAGSDFAAIYVGPELPNQNSPTQTLPPLARTGERDTIRNVEFVAFSNNPTVRVPVTDLPIRPNVTVNIVDTTLNDADNSSQVTFTFSKAIAAGTFTLEDASVTNGVLSGLVIAPDGLSATATFTATDNISATGSVSVAADRFTDAAGNQNTDSNTDTVAIDTTNPDTTKPSVAVDIVDTTLNDADNTSQVTFTFSEAIDAASFTFDDVSATNGLLSGLVIAADGLSATATFTATDNINGTGSVSVAADRFTDLAGNQNDASNSDTVAINTVTSSSAIIEGGPGPDTLRGTPDSDIMDGKGGNDTLLGSADADQMIGGPGRDTVRYTRTVMLDLENEDRSTGQARGDAFDSIERFQFSNGSDRVFGDADANQFFGGSGSDHLHGAGGNDVLRGEDGRDQLFGEEGNDRLFGGNGRDLLVGGLGRDRINGDAGADRYDFNTVQESGVGSQRDVVYFSGEDRIDLRTIDADEDTLGNQAFRWVNRNDLDAAFTGRDGQLRFSNGVLRGDTDGDKVADFEIKVVGLFSSGDVIL